MSFNENRAAIKNRHKRSNRLDHKLENAQAQIRKLQSLRVWTGIITSLGFLVAAIAPGLNLAVPAFVFFALVFPFLVRASRQWTRHRNLLAQWKEFELRQMSRCLGTWKAQDQAAEIRALDQFGVGYDLDLIGEKSLFNQMNETFSLGGAKKLASWMLQDPKPELIQVRQSLLKSLYPSRWFFTRFCIHAPAQKEAQFSSAVMLNEIETFPKPSTGIILGLAFVIAVWIASLVLIFSYPALWIVFFIVNMVYLYKSGPLLGRSEGIIHHFSTLAPSFAVLESDRMPAALRSACKVIRTEKPAQRINRFNWTLVGLSIESHPLVYLIVNFLFPWSAIFSFILIRQVDGVRKCLKECFAELEEVEAISSLVIFTSDQTSTFPEISGEPMLATVQTRHPLIDQSKVVQNDFSYGAAEKMILLTGSNMSGKSTFLRTLGINQVLTNMGAPVFAQSFKTYPFRIRSCIRVSDSIEQGFSYFYAEVQRLKKVLDEAEKPPSVLYLIDEIFRGTNNRERLTGSQAVIQHLLKSPAMGFVTTHDLELTQISETSKGMRNYHFRDEAVGNQMIFSYELHEGPCPTTNALKIMRGSGLPV